MPSKQLLLCIWCFVIACLTSVVRECHKAVQTKHEISWVGVFFSALHAGCMTDFLILGLRYQKPDFPDVGAYCASFAVGLATTKAFNGFGGLGAMALRYFLKDIDLTSIEGGPKHGRSHDPKPPGNGGG